MKSLLAACFVLAGLSAAPPPRCDGLRGLPRHNRPRRVQAHDEHAVAEQRAGSVSARHGRTTAAWATLRVEVFVCRKLWASKEELPALCRKGAELKSTSSPSLGEQKAWRSRPISETRCGEELKRNESEYAGEDIDGEERAGPHLHRGPGWGRLARSRWGCSRAHARCAREEIVHTPIPGARKP